MSQINNSVIGIIMYIQPGLISHDFEVSGGLEEVYYTPDACWYPQAHGFKITINITLLHK